MFEILAGIFQISFYLGVGTVIFSIGWWVSVVLLNQIGALFAHCLILLQRILNG